MNIILQHWAGEMSDLVWKSAANISAYARSIGAEYDFLEGDVFRSGLAPQSQKLYMLDEAWDAYDIVVMLDSDMFAVRGLAENVFDLEGTGMRTAHQDDVFRRCLRDHPRLSDARFAFWGGAIWRLTRERRQALRVHLNDREMREFNEDFHDEGIMHRLACLAGIKQDRIPERWCFSSYLPNPETAAMIHIRAKSEHGKRTKLENYRDLVARGVL
jgi:hypothetical protein